MQNEKISSFALRQAIRTKYAWPGGYTIFGITSDGAALCCDCMRAEYYQIAYERRHDVHGGWHIVAVDCMANVDDAVNCDHCGKDL